MRVTEAGSTQLGFWEEEKEEQGRAQDWGRRGQRQGSWLQNACPPLVLSSSHKRPVWVKVALAAPNPTISRPCRSGTHASLSSHLWLPKSSPERVVVHPQALCRATSRPPSPALCSVDLVCQDPVCVHGWYHYLQGPGEHLCPACRLRHPGKSLTSLRRGKSLEEYLDCQNPSTTHSCLPPMGLAPGWKM